MERIEKVIRVNTVEQIPSIDELKETSREMVVRIICTGNLKLKTIEICQKLKKNLVNLYVKQYCISEDIVITKLIKAEEVIGNQLFFQRYAMDYRSLSTELIYELAESLKISIDPQSPITTFNPLKWDERGIGEVGDWSYYMHAIHCGFTNKITGQLVETPLTFGLEFGELDPFFFTRFIKSTPNYQPLLVEIYEDYEDGVQILKIMFKIGKFKKVVSNSGDVFGFVVRDSVKIL